MAGKSELEGELADLLIEDLHHLIQHRDMDFVNKVFIPLIKVEKTLPITIGAARTNSDQLQPSMMPGISSLVEPEDSAASS